MSSLGALFPGKPKDQEEVVQILDILEKEIIPSLKEGKEDVAIAALNNQMAKHPALHTYHAVAHKIDSMDTPSILQFAKLWSNTNASSKFVHAFLHECKLTKPDDRFVLFLLQIFLYTSDTVVKEIIDGHLVQALGEKRTNVVRVVAQNQIPTKESHIALLKGNLAIPFLPILHKLLVHSSTTVRTAIMVSFGSLEECHEEVIPSLLNALQDKSADVCKAAANSLVNFGAVAVPFLCDSLASEDVRVRTAAAWGLGKIGNLAKMAIPSLLKALGDEDAKVRKPAQWALENIGKEIIPELLQHLKEDRGIWPLVCGANILGGLHADSNEAVAFLFSLCQHEDETVQSSALKNLSEARLTKTEDISQASSFFVKALSSNSNTVKTAVAEILEKWPHLVHGASEHLLKMVQSDDEKMRIAGLSALGNVGKGDASEIRAIIESIREKNANIKLAAIKTVGKLGEKAQDAVLELMEVICSNNPDPTVALCAMDSLKRLGKAVQQTLPVLLHTIVSGNVAIREKSAEVLGSIGIPACAELMRLAGGATVEVRKDIIKALTIVGKDAIPTLTQAMMGVSQERRTVASEVLGNLGLDAWPDVKKLMKSEDFWIRKAACRAAEKMGSPIVAELLKTVKEHEDTNLTASSFEILKRLKEKSLAPLISYISDMDTRISQFVIQTVQKVGPTYESAIPELIQLFSNPDPMVRRAAAWCLERIGKPSPEVLQALQTLETTDKSPDVCVTASQAWKKLSQMPAVPGTSEAILPSPGND